MFIYWSILTWCRVYEIEPAVWGRVGPDPRLLPQVDTAQGPQALGLGRPGDLDCLSHYPNVGAVIRLECQNMLSSDTIYIPDRSGVYLQLFVVECTLEVHCKLNSVP